ncbi:MAG: DUF262 domain-containing HNH endonuclease family protein [Chloroflexus sp.]|nr:DUF262 domain-containing HNH endonuclease family protein [Chloroflexus sp.]
MSRATMLNTRTISFLELVGNGKHYRVPPYQRDYSWSEEQWEDLWSDILALRRQVSEYHYMGALVVQEAGNDHDLLIIDGQQRMATLSILALAIIDRLGELAKQGVEADHNRERAKELRNRFIGERDPASLIESSRLTLNETDNPFYQDYLVQLREPLNPRGLPRSNRLMWQCFQYFKKKLEELRDIQQNGFELARLLSETMARQLLFILITVADDLNAYIVFETLNARGLELTTTDLLKNYLFSLVKVKADREALQRRWQKLIDTVTPERFPEFLRYHLLCELPQVRSQRLFKLVREQVQEPVAVFTLLAALEARAELFTALSDPAHGFWIDLSEARPYIRELNLFRVRQMTPVLFAAWEAFIPDNPANFVSVLRIVSIISFRYTVVSALNPNGLEPVYHEAAKALISGQTKTPAAVFELLRPIYVPDPKFENDFATLSIPTSGQRKKLVKYILSMIESYLSGRHCDPDTDPATIEHILPENPSHEWEQTFPRTHWEAAVYRLGNVTLLNAPANRHASNAGYREKLAIYRQSTYQLTKSIAELAPEEWTMELLERRQRDLARIAKMVWRIDAG